MKLLITLSVLLLSIHSIGFSQGHNYKSGSHRGYHNPYAQKQRPSAWSGSGIAIGTQMFATNHHVVDGATNLYVYFPETKAKYKAETICVDSNNDLAIVRVVDPKFKGFPAIKYGFKKQVEDVGVGVFVLGYPMVATMGEEVKLTTGVVSSRSGYQGNVSQYQISAPVQPGNSGGPLFNEYGELIGIVSAKHTEADNASYGVKLSYLHELANKSSVKINFEKSSELKSSSLSEKCKAIIPCTIMVLADNQRESTETAQTAAQSSQTATPATRSTNGGAVRINNPSVQKGDKNLHIYGIEITSKYTALYMAYRNTEYPQGGWYNFSPKTFIQTPSGQKYTLKTTENCAIAPKRTDISHNAIKEFVLYFPPIPTDTKTIDLIEPEGNDSWKIYGIGL
ncbi:MAG: trypsin-like peptidase domain-containing protein [Alistipes sp.]|nr:trypsin-like peptidase domain-containing protein [Alistipes sp.]